MKNNRFKNKKIVTLTLSLFAVFILFSMAAAANEADDNIKPSNSQPPVKSTETFFIDPFDSEPPKADTQTPDTWYPDRYPPAGFNSSYYDGDNRLNVTIDKDDYLPHGTTFHNYQGRKYDLANPINTYLTADLYIGSEWETENRHASLWATTFNETDEISGYPIFGFTNGSGFKIYSQDVDQDGNDTDGDGDLEAGWYTVGFPTSVWNGYDAWYTLEIKLTASSYKYYINDELVWTDIMTFNSTYFGNMMLQGYNYNETYNIYWDNVGTAGPVENIDTGEEFSTIQLAIDDSDTLEGHTISVTDLTLGTSVNVTKNDLTFDLSDMSIVSGIVTENKSYNLAENVESTFIGATSLVFDGMQINTTGGNIVNVNNLNICINITADEMSDPTDAPMWVHGQENELIITGDNTFDGRDDKLDFYGTIYYPYGAPGILVQANRYEPNDELIISGSGELTALGASWCAGIGGSGYRYAGNVTINSGTIIAEGHSLGAGIGGGQDSGRQDETATGYEHNWRPEPSPQVITINGGDVTATGGYGGAGIGTGGDCYNDTHGGTITINGGTIHAYGGDHAAGIGCGQSNAYELDHGTGGDITLTGGTIYAISGGDNASGIGGGGTYGDYGLGGNCGTICIYPAATIYATGGANVDDIGPGLNGDDCTYCDLPDPICRNVEDNLEFITIQEAIDASTTDGGETIEVYEGTHNQNFEISKRVNIIGSGSRSNPSVITQTAAGAGDTHIGVIQLNESGLSETNPISIKNLRIEPIGMAGLSVGRFYQDTQTTVSYIELDNVTVIGTNSNPSTEQERGLYVDTTSSLSYLNVVDSAFNNLTYGWYFQKIVSDDASTVDHVTVTNTEFNHNNHKGIYAEKLEDATFSDCTINENGYDSSILPSYFQAWSAGIDLNLKAGDYETFVFDNCIFSDNAIDEAKEGVALTVKERGTGNNPSGSYSSYPAHCDDVTVTSCTFTNNERGMRFGEPGKENIGPTNVTVEYCNLIDNNQHYSGTDGSAYGGLINQMQAEIIAECNWYNDISGPGGDGPGTGDAVQEVLGSIDYIPWLDDTYPDGDCVGGECADPVYVDDDAASSWYDWDHCADIQTAIDRVCVGGTVYVSAGAYNETLVVDKALSLIGESRDTTIVNNPVNTSTLYTLKIDGNLPGLTGDVLVEGFTFNGNEEWNAVVGTDHIPAGITLTFRENTINDNYLYGLYDYHSHGNFECHDNIFSNIEYGMMLEGWDTGAVNIYDNDFDVTPGYFGYPAGIFCFTYSYLNCTNPYYIAGNTFDTSSGGYGVVFYAGYGSGYDAAQYTDVTIEHNEFNALGYYGVFLRNYVPADQNDIGGVHNAYIEYNNFTDCNYAVRVYDNNSNINVHYNNFYHTPGFKQVTEVMKPVTDESIPSIQFGILPSFDIYSYGVDNTGIYTVDATCNWWGEVSGPYHSIDNVNGLGCNVSDTVDFIPWLDKAYPDGDCVGGECADPIWVDDDQTAGWYDWDHVDSIQTAVDRLCVGGTIYVAPGTYDEAVIIDKSLTMIGSGNDQTFVKSSAKAAVMTITADDVYIQDLEITDDTQLIEGIRISTGASTDLTIDNVDFTNLGNNPGPGNAYGIVFDTSFTNFYVDNCDFIATNIGEYSRAIGIFAGKNNGYELSNINIENSSFAYLFVGIYISADTNGLNVLNNDFGPWELEDCTAAVAGLYMGDGKDNYDLENIVVAGNTFTSYGRGVYMWNYAPEQIYGKIDIYDNTFTDSIWSSAIRLIAGNGYNENVSFEGPITIQDNIFDQSTDVGANVAMIDFRSYCKLPSCDIAIKNNDITFSGSSYVDGMYGIKFSAYAGPFTNTLIEENTLNGGGTGGSGTIPSSGIVIDHYASTDWPTDLFDMDVVYNNITGFDHGVSIYDNNAAGYGGLPTGSTVNINYNNIYDNIVYGIRNDNGETIDATCNWWGHISGPYHPTDNVDGTGCNVSDSVTFIPWLTDEYPDGDCEGQPESLLVEQTVFDRGFPIRHAVDGDWGGAQSFSPVSLPSMSIITRAELYMRKFGTPEFDLTVELHSGSPDGALLASQVIPAGDVPSTWNWLSVDFDYTDIEPGVDYYIVCPPAPSGVTTSFGYEWGYAFGDQYPGGSFWFTRDGGDLWRGLPTMYEMVFKVYVMG